MLVFWPAASVPVDDKVLAAAATVAVELVASERMVVVATAADALARAGMRQLISRVASILLTCSDLSGALVGSRDSKCSSSRCGSNSGGSTDGT